MRKRWGGCWGGLACFGTQKGGKRIVPASRITEANALVNQPNGVQAVGLTNQLTTSVAPSLLAPPSSPASFSNSAIPSTAQSPSCFLSANSPEGGPSNTMYATGPYANETQLVSPPVFSTFTTEPSTAPLTPPPEMAHLTTPSSPDVPFAQFLSSSMDHLKRGTTDKNNSYIAANDLQATYSLYPGSPASSHISPVSRTSGGNCLSSSSFPEREFPHYWDPSSLSSSQDANRYPRSESGRFFGLDDTANASKLSQDSNFFCPATFAQFYLDHSPFPNSGGRLSVSRESDAYSGGNGNGNGNGNQHQNRQNKSCKQDVVEEVEAYRASFGFSADEIITTTQYVEIADVFEDSFTMTPFTSSEPHVEESVSPASLNGRQKSESTHSDLLSLKNHKFESEHVDLGPRREVPDSSNVIKDHTLKRQAGGVSSQTTPVNIIRSTDEEDDIFSKMGASKISRKYHLGLSSSDAEIDYRRGRSMRQRKGEFACYD